MDKPTIQISAPVRNRELYLPSYLDAIYNQNYDRKKITLYFLLNDSTDNSEKILNSFKKEHEHEYHKIKIDKWDCNTPEDIGRDGEIRMNYIYTHLAKMRNYLLRTNKSEMYISVDTDIMLHNPETINGFVKNNFDICSALIINGYHMFEGKQTQFFTNILQKDNRGGYIHVRNVKLNGILEVDFSGAIIAMKKEVTKNTKIQYGFHHQGEDLPFCLSAQEQGYKIFCDTSIKATHCMTEEYLEKYKKGEFIFE